MSKELESTQTIKDIFNSARLYGPAMLRGSTYPKTYNLAVPGSANVDFYTCPVGRKALVLDLIMTNNTGATVTYYPLIKIAGTYYKIGASKSENPAGLGHNYGMAAQNSSQPILLNAGETFAVHTDNPNSSIWPNIIEFSDNTPIFRADLTTWINGNNILFTVPVGKTIFAGVLGHPSATNNPAPQAMSIVYFNNSGVTVTISSINFVPVSGSPGSANQFAAPGAIVDQLGFPKYFHGGLGGGDQIVFQSNSAAAGQYAWMNYVLA